MELIKGFFLQLISSVGVIALFGLVIALLRRAFCAVAPKNGPRILLVTGIIGTPIHELSHALMCLIFGHKITEIKLYEPGSQDGTLGHVSHSFNKKNIYHQIGNFFVGTAPILLGGAVTVLLMALLLPSAFDTIISNVGILASMNISTLQISEYFSYIGDAIASIFSTSSISSWQGWLFILLAIMISSHMEMSGADIKNSSLGFIFLSILLLIVDGAIYLISPESLEAVNSAAASLGLILSAFLSISVLFLLTILIIALIFKAITSIIRK